ncbi:MAG: methylated-DNA--[protein]-cysteine S-methyltransferase [Desulfobulbus sp.]|nr:methylated-DNA--[protein]-cysteine S-methyltransferase [Desulfobulbus sp.]
MEAFVTLPTPLGEFTLAANNNGICAIHLPTSMKALPFSPGSQLALDPPPLLTEACRQLHAYLKGELEVFDLPLSLQGTPFQKQVWQELLTIPYGQTRTYGELAQRLGGRGKARAVGGAAHANPIAIVIPCHRLIGAGGKLTGFGGGLPMKQTLLDLEQNNLGWAK